MSQDLFIATSRHPVLAELTERYQVASNAFQDLVNCRKALLEKRDLISRRNPLSFARRYADAANDVALERSRDVAVIRQQKAITVVTEAVDRLLPIMKRAVADFGVSFSIWSDCEVAMVKNNLLCAGTLRTAINDLIREIQEEQSCHNFERCDFAAIDAEYERFIQSFY